jgi:hypothetical protein
MYVIEMIHSRAIFLCVYAYIPLDLALAMTYSYTAVRWITPLH